MSKLAKVVCSGVLALIMPSCSAVPKPPEMVALEKLRDAPGLSAEDRRSFDLLACADELLLQAGRKWDQGDTKAASRLALEGQIKMKTGIALLQATRAKSRLADIAIEQAAADVELSRVREAQEAAQDEIALLGQLIAAKARTREEHSVLTRQLDATRKAAALEKQATAERRRAAALKNVHLAETAVKAAEAVASPAYASARYAVASRMLQEAHRALDSERWEDASSRATLAMTEAARAIERARPQYELTKPVMSPATRDQALEADASAIVGVEVRRESDGDLRRVVLLLRDAFEDSSAKLSATGVKMVDELAALSTRYPTYPVQLGGHAAGQTPGSRETVSLARANAIYWALVQRGVDSRRMSIEGALAQPADLGAHGAVSDPASVQANLTLFYYVTQNSPGTVAPATPPAAPFDQAEPPISAVP